MYDIGGTRAIYMYTCQGLFMVAWRGGGVCGVVGGLVMSGGGVGVLDSSSIG